jgi:hypothetical protein
LAETLAHGFTLWPGLLRNMVAGFQNPTFQEREHQAETMLAFRISFGSHTVSFLSILWIEAGSSTLPHLSIEDFIVTV